MGGSEKCKQFNNLDDIYEHKVGEFGRWQKVMFILLGYGAMPAAIQALVAAFTQATPDYKCVTEGVASQYQMERCPDITVHEKCGNSTNKCLDFQFSKDVYQTTVTEEFNLVCDRAFYGIFLKMIFYFGFSIGAFLAGLVADNLGRKNAILIGSITGFVVDFACSYTESLVVYFLCRFLAGITGMMVFVCSFVLLMEFSGKSIRGTLGLHHSGSFFALGFCTCAWVAYYIRDWRTLQRTVAFCHIPNIIFMMFIEESPRWLASKGRIAEAKGSLQILAIKNRKYEGANGFEVPINTDNDEGKKYNQLDMFRQGKNMTKIILTLMYLWISVAISYYVLTLGGANLPGSIYFNTFMLCLVEIPGCFLVQFLFPRFGRRLATGYCYLASAVACWVSMISGELGYCEVKADNLTNHWVILNLLFGFAGKLTLCGAFAAIWVWTAELFPTPVRATGQGLTSSAGRFSLILTPGIISLYHLVSWLPGTMLGFAAVLGWWFCLQLPETEGRPMLTTFEEAEKLYTTKNKGLDYSDEDDQKLKADV